MSSTKKFLVCGDVEGNFDALNNKISSLIKKGQKFDFLLCIGSTLSLDFNIQDYITLKKRFPIRTYFIDSSELSQCLMHKYQGIEEICPNFFFLGRSGLYTIENLDICFISGVQSHQHTELYSENHVHKTSFTGPYFTQTDIVQIQEEVKRKSNFKGVDIFLSNEWPYGLENHTSLQNNGQHLSERSLKIAEIADLVCPRYHFAARNGVYLARAPYMNRLKFMSRFIGFGKISQGGEQKYMGAYSVVPLKEMDTKDLMSYSDDCTQNPYVGEGFLQPYKQIEEEELEQEEQDQNQENEGWGDGDEDDTLKKMEEKHIHAVEQNKILEQQKNKLTENVILFVGHFDKYSNSDDIAEFLSRWGQIEALELVYDDNTKKHKGYGFVKYASLKTTESALRESGQYSLHGAKITFKVKSGQENQIMQNDAVCWFCFSSPDIDTNLIFYEGNEIYLALDKGPITDMHFLIIPKDHVKNQVSLSLGAKNEVKQILEKMNGIFNKQYGKTLICFERYMKLHSNKAHMIIHCVPIEIGKTQNFTHKFENGVRAHRLNFFKMKKDEEIDEFVSKQMYYFYLELSGQDKYLYAFKEGVKFHYDFGRQIICEIFTINKSNWKDCIISERELKKDIQELQFQLSK